MVIFFEFSFYKTFLLIISPDSPTSSPMKKRAVFSQKQSPFTRRANTAFSKTTLSFNDIGAFQFSHLDSTNQFFKFRFTMLAMLGNNSQTSLQILRIFHLSLVTLPLDPVLLLATHSIHLRGRMTIWKASLSTCSGSWSWVLRIDASLLYVCHAIILVDVLHCYCDTPICISICTSYFLKIVLLTLCTALLLQHSYMHHYLYCLFSQVCTTHIYASISLLCTVPFICIWFKINHKINKFSSLQKIWVWCFLKPFVQGICKCGAKQTYSASRCSTQI